ncbi:MAG: FAD-dependent oxidoreductase [Alistipes sp.]
MNKHNSVLLPASLFAERGGWTADQQFIDIMGSTYLLAHGLGEAVADASTEFDVPADGDYNLYVRTRNWTAYWSDAPTEGTFNVIIDGRNEGTLFGTECSEWHWQQGSTLHLSQGRHCIALHDLHGFDARCDAILLTSSAVRPDDSVEGYRALRKKLLGLPSKAVRKGKYDFVVVGGGVAGMCAAIAAARLGTRVALIQDRHVLGGNNSSEIRVGLGGRLNIGMYPSLGYLLNEFGPSTKGNARTPEIYEDEKKMAVVKAERRITLFTGYRVCGVEKSDEHTIKSVTAMNVDDYSQIRIEGRLFADCTGDAVLGVLAGAEWHMGREAKSEYGEESAPDVADGMTMGASLQWYCLEDDKPRPFPDIKWGLPVDERSVQKVRRGQWYWEVGMRDDQIADAERIRDYGMYVAYSNWAYLKNRFSQKDEYANSYLGWVSCVAGKRESRRLIGEFILREQDLKNNVIYPDASASTSWYIDQHYPDPENSKLFPGREYLSCGHLDPLGFYPIPYRCFYSKDIANMFMAGRDISVSHVALGTVRVMRTTAMMGEVVGMAASVCRRRKALPRDVYTTYLEELKALMRKGAGRTDVPYMQVYTLIDTTAARSEDC